MVDVVRDGVSLMLVIINFLIGIILVLENGYNLLVSFKCVDVGFENWKFLRVYFFIVILRIVMVMLIIFIFIFLDFIIINLL